MSFEGIKRGREKYWVREEMQPGYGGGGGWGAGQESPMARAVRWSCGKTHKRGEWERLGGWSIGWAGCSQAEAHTLMCQRNPRTVEANLRIRLLDWRGSVSWWFMVLHRTWWLGRLLPRADLFVCRLTSKSKEKRAKLRESGKESNRKSGLGFSRKKHWNCSLLFLLAGPFRSHPTTHVLDDKSVNYLPTWLALWSVVSSTTRYILFTEAYTQPRESSFFFIVIDVSTLSHYSLWFNRSFPVSRQFVLSKTSSISEPEFLTLLKSLHYEDRWEWNLCSVAE